MKAVRRLHALLAEDAIILAPGCHDALGAYFIQRAGFKTAYMTGYGAACSLLGRPDLGELTMTEIVDHAGRIADAIEIPLICDADTGYGGPLNVQRTVREFEKAGVAAIHIEDQVEPKRCAAMKGIAVTDLDTAVKKIRAAVSAKEDPDFIIIARTDSRPLWVLITPSKEPGLLPKQARTWFMWRCCAVRKRWRLSPNLSKKHPFYSTVSTIPQFRR